MGNLDSTREYLAETVEILQQIGPERVTELDNALTEQYWRGMSRLILPPYVVEVDEKGVHSSDLIDRAVAGYTPRVKRPVGHHTYAGDWDSLTIVGYETVAVALLESAQSRRGQEKWLMGKLSIHGAINGHNHRLVNAANRARWAIYRGQEI